MPLPDAALQSGSGDISSFSVGPRKSVLGRAFGAATNVARAAASTAKGGSSIASVFSIPLDLLSWILGAGLRNQGSLAWQDQQSFPDSYSIRCALMQLSLPLDTLANRLLQLEKV